MTNPSVQNRLDNEAETEALARRIAGVARPGDVIFLIGDLGAGKTVFARAFIRALVGEESEEVPSPTFTLLQVYETEKGPVFHFDLYRISDGSEVHELGLEEALSEGITLIEWPDRLGGAIPENRLEVVLDYDQSSPAARTVSLEGRGTWKPRVQELRASG